MPPRRHENTEVGQQLYAAIEYCRKPHDPVVEARHRALRLARYAA
ncbi:MAG TPA: hypothetical protein VE575_03960 [Acidimicrobiales bacterium]|jgi:hypothetical protein|nr:hypothetical protein [Acidimicrobiales bacterium]